MAVDVVHVFVSTSAASIQDSPDYSVLTKINTSPALLMSSTQGTDLLFLRFAFLSMSCTFNNKNETNNNNL